MSKRVMSRYQADSFTGYGVAGRRAAMRQPSRQAVLLLLELE